MLQGLLDANNFVKQTAMEIGFDACGISQVCSLIDIYPIITSWLKNRYNADMSFMERNLEKRLHPGLLVNNSCSIISVLLNYYPHQIQEGEFKIAKFAYGKDYHVVMKEMLFKLAETIQEKYGKINYRCFVDSAPVLEREWAARAGLGWIGKNTCLITKTGSYYFIGEIICDLKLSYDTAINNRCGKCSKCIESCPTGALQHNSGLDARKCISWATIEAKDDISSVQNRNANFIFGCDICQDVCPWNKKAKPTKTLCFDLKEKLKCMQTNDWRNLKNEEFLELFKNSTVKRTGFDKMQKNIKSLHSNQI